MASCTVARRAICEVRPAVLHLRVRGMGHDALDCPPAYPALHARGGQQLRLIDITGLESMALS